MQLETGRLLLRRWRDADLDAFAAMNADPRVMEYFQSLLTRDQSREFLLRITAHFEMHGFGLYAAELKATGAVTGYVGLSRPLFEAHFTPCVEIGWRFAHEYWGKGLATEGAQAVVDYGFQRLGLGEIVSFTVPANVRSRRVMEKLGMTHNPADDFDHPNIPANHPLRRHVLYRLRMRIPSTC